MPFTCAAAPAARRARPRAHGRLRGEGPRPPRRGRRADRAPHPRVREVLHEPGALDAELREVLRARLVLRGRLEDPLQDLAVFSQNVQQNFSHLFF